MDRVVVVLGPDAKDIRNGVPALEARGVRVATNRRPERGMLSSIQTGLREASGDHALYVDEITPESLAEAMERLIRNPDERTALARAGQRHVMDVHSPRQRSAELKQIRKAVVLSGRRLAA